MSLLTGCSCAKYKDMTVRGFRIENGTLPWAIFHFRIFSNYFLQKFEKIKITV